MSKKCATRLDSPGFRSNTSIVIISLDCVRPEALGCYPQRFPPQTGKPRKAGTPNLDRLAAEGCRFDQVITQAPYTPAAHASLFTGLYPPRHGIRAMRGYKLTPDATTLAEITRASGYQTAAFIGCDALSKDYGLQRGFDLYDDAFDRGMANWVLGYRRFGDEITDKAINWLQGREAGKPYLLFLHYFDVHSLDVETAVALDRSVLGTVLAWLHHKGPRFLPKVYHKAVRHLYRRYFRARCAGRAYHLRKVGELDSHLGRLLAYLRESGLYDRSLIVITADHGDAFGEHGETGHRRFLYDTTLRIPLIIKAAAKFSGRVVTGLARLVDVLPTVCDLAGIDAVAPRDIDGISLVPLMLGITSDVSAYSETSRERSSLDWQTLAQHFSSLRTDKWKLIWNRLDDSVQLFDIEHDPDELFNVSDGHPDAVAGMSADLDLILAQAVACDHADAAALTDSELTEAKDRLRALGYL